MLEQRFDDVWSGGDRRRGAGLVDASTSWASCQGLRALQQSIVGYAGQFDAHRLSAAEAGEVVRLAAQGEASLASIKALAAARAAEGRSWEHDGYRSASEQLAAHAGMSPAAAKRSQETGRRLADQPEVAAAALAGQVSLEQATAISDGVAANPDKAAELLDKATRCSLPELNEEVARVKAACSASAAAVTRRRSRPVLGRRHRRRHISARVETAASSEEVGREPDPDHGSHRSRRPDPRCAP